MDTVIKLIIVLLLILCNAFFVASEFALIGVRRTRIDELVKKGNKAAQLIQKALDDRNRFISATQLGVTLASLAIGWLGEPAMAQVVEPLFHFLPQTVAKFSEHTIAIVIAFSIITFIHIIVGELTPKTISLQKTEKIAFFIIRPLYIFADIFRPFIWLLNNTGKLILRIFGMQSVGDKLVYSEGEIAMLLSQSAQSGAIEQQEAEMVYKAFRLNDVPIQNMMIPRTDVIAFNASTKLQEIEKVINEKNFSRFPVYEGTIDNIIGFVHIKDLYKLLLAKQEHKRLSETHTIRQIISVPEIKNASDVLVDMRRKRIHIAVVNDEYGGTAGVVTPENVFESIFGDYKDEFEEPAHEITRQKDGTYLVHGLVTIDQIQQKFKLPIKRHGYTTIGGLVFGLI